MGQDTRYMHDEYRQILQNQEHQNNWQSEQNEIDRQWQEQQWLQQFNLETARQNEMFDKESQRWQDQFDIANSYNAPTAEVARLAAAGINPSVAAAGSHGASSASPMSGGSSSSPNPSGLQGKSVSPAAPPSFHSVNNAAQMFSSIAQLNDSLAQMAKSGSDISVEQRKVKPIIENVAADTQNKQASTALTDVLKDIKQAYGSSETYSSIVKNLAESEEASARGDNERALKRYNDALTALTEQERLQKNEAFPQILANLKTYGETLKSQSVSNYASASESRSQSAYYVALTKTEDGLRSGRIKMQDLQNEISDYVRMSSQVQARIDYATEQDRVSSIVSAAEQQGLINRSIAQDIRKKIQDNDWNGVEHAMGCLNQAIGSFSQVGNLELDALNADSRRKIADSMEKYYNQDYTVTRKDKKGRTHTLRGNYEDIYHRYPGK